MALFPTALGMSAQNHITINGLDVSYTVRTSEGKADNGTSTSVQEENGIDEAQLTAVYSFTVQTTDADGGEETDSMRVAVQLGKKVVKSMPYSDYVSQTTGELDLEDSYTEAGVHMPTIWQNYPQGQMTSRELIFPKKYEASEKMPEMQWELTGDTLTVCGYHCSLATAEFAGLKWRVWFTEEIPVSAGPWKLQGLPGLIVSAEDEGAVHKFELLGMQTESTAVTYMPDAKAVKLSEKQLVKFRNKTYCNSEYVKNPLYYVDSSSIENVALVTVGGTPRPLMNGHMMPSTVHVFKPLELDK